MVDLELPLSQIIKGIHAAEGVAYWNFCPIAHAVERKAVAFVLVKRDYLGSLDLFFNIFSYTFLHDSSNELNLFLIFVLRFALIIIPEDGISFAFGDRVEGDGDDEPDDLER